MAGKELATRADLEDRYPAIFGETADEIAELIESNLGDDDEIRASDFPRYKVPSGGGVVWTDTSAGDDDDPVKKVRGILLARNTPRAFWRQTIEERAAAANDDKTPDCSSPDGKYGIGEFGNQTRDPETRAVVPNSNPANPTGACKTCPMNQFNTARQGGGKGCKQREAWWIKEEGGGMFPKQVQVPSASLQNSHKYRVGLMAAGKDVSGVVTEFGLKSETNKAGTKYSAVTFNDVEVLDRESTRMAKAFGAQMKDMLAESAYVEATSGDDPEAPTKAAWNPADPADGGTDPNDPWADDENTAPGK